MKRVVPSLFVLSLLVLLAAPAARAHPLDPALLELRETAGAPLEVLWRLPAAQPRDAPLRPVLPDRCRQLEPAAVSRGGERVSFRWRMDCGVRSLAGERVAVDGLAARGTDALVRVHLADGRLVQAVLRGAAPALTVPERAGAARVFGTYLGFGFEHILGGFDHLLFVLGLVLLVRGRRLLGTITAFTAGHSVTLSLAALGLMRVPRAPVEALIAASIFAVAVELTRETQGRTALWRSPWLLTFAFGLLHGLGFAGALAEVGLPAGEIPAALFSFNCGIELGQLLFVGALLAAGAVRTALRRALPAPEMLGWRLAAGVPAYVIGTLAAYWTLQRIGATF